MKVCIYSDVHWSQNSSIIRRRGEHYSSRLENLIESVNWVEQIAWNNDADCVICCGDFFDSSVLNSEEISALQKIRWAPISHLFLTGNHETNVSSLEYSTTDLFKLCPNVAVINTPQQYFIDNSSVEFCFLPYVLERDRKSVVEYFGHPTCNRVIFSHNDLKDVQYGPFVSTEGFEINDIHEHCNLYFNGHIHHCSNVTNKIINVGNLTGQNFTEDATKYSHCAIILDLETLSYTFHINPHAFRFYKLDLSNCVNTEDLRKELNILKYNSVITLTVNESLYDQTKDILEQLKADRTVCEYRLLKKNLVTQNVSTEVVIPTTDHLKQFENYVLTQIGSTDVIKEELNHIMR